MKYTLPRGSLCCEDCSLFMRKKIGIYKCKEFLGHTSHFFESLKLLDVFFSGVHIQLFKRLICVICAFLFSETGLSTSV